MAMDWQKLNVKFFVAGSGRAPLATFIQVFNAWIQTSDGEYYDIAEYSHVHAGPGILLVAHEANVSMDETEGRLGLLYNRKQPLPGSNQEKLLRAFRSALGYCRRIETEPALQGRVKFSGSEALFLINDRLLAPNSEETFQAVRPELAALAGVLYQGAGCSLERDADPRKRFSVHIRTPTRFDIATLLKNLEQAERKKGLSHDSSHAGAR